MIAKIKANNNLYGTLMYNHQKVEDNEAKVLCVNEMWESATGEYKISDFTSAFNMRLAKNNRTKSPIVHISMNPHPLDVLTDEQMLTIACEYMQRLGFGEQPYVIFKHEDIERHHMHIVTTNIKPDGSKLNDGYIKRRSKAITEDIERKYKLHPAEVKQGNEPWQPDKVSVEKGRIRYQIKNIAKHLVDEYCFQTVNELKAALLLYNVDMQIVKSADGAQHTYTGTLYSATDDKGNRIASPIKASNLGKEYVLHAIEKKMEGKAEMLKSLDKNSTKQALKSGVAQSKSKEELLQNLKEKGIDILFRVNESGRIYGATIIDHSVKIIVNGSKLGKEFSANAFQALFEQWANERPVREEEKVSPAKEKSSNAESIGSGMALEQNDPVVSAGEVNDRANDSSNSSNGDFNLEEAGLAFAELLAGLFDVPEEQPHREERFIPDKKKKKKKKKNQRQL
jgi:hypothetical protein